MIPVKTASGSGSSEKQISCEDKFVKTQAIILAIAFLISACAVSQDQSSRGNAPGVGCAEPPVYPARAARECIEGFVTLQFSLDRQGYPEKIQVVKSEPERVFDEAAIQSLSSCRFQLQEQNSGRVTQTIEFALQGGPCASYEQGASWARNNSTSLM